MTADNAGQHLNVTPGNIPNDGIMFVDHSKAHRGGHLGHALVQCANDDVLAFYPNCGSEFEGHSGNGWMEYKRSSDEYNPDYCISDDMGKTWNKPGTIYMAKRIRNPQLVRFGSGYYMHGRSGNFGDKALMGHLVIYYSEDAIHWDEGHYLQMRGTGAGAYSNNLVIRVPGTDKERLYIQSSHAYEQYLTNIVSFWIDE